MKTPIYAQDQADWLLYSKIMVDGTFDIGPPALRPEGWTGKGHLMTISSLLEETPLVDTSFSLGSYNAFKFYSIIFYSIVIVFYFHLIHRFLSLFSLLGLIADLLFKAVVKCNKNILSLIKWGRAFEESLKISSKQMING